MISVKYSNKRVYFHSFKKAFSTSIGAAVICLLVMLLLIPVSTSIIHDSSIFNLTYTHHQMKYRFFYESLRPLVNGAAVISGILISLVQFRFMLIKRYSDAYFSFGIRRGTLFLLHSIAGILQIFFIVFIPMFISMLMNLAAFGELGYGSVIFSGFIFMTMGLFTLSFLGFAAASLICSVSGTLIEAVSFSILILAAPSIILYGINALTKTLLFGNAFGVTASTGTIGAAETLLNKLDFLNPVYFFYNISASYNLQSEHLDDYVLPDMQWGRIAGWIVCGIIIFIMGIMLLKRRKAEIAGISGQNFIMNFIFTFLVSFLGFCVVLEFLIFAGMSLAIAASVLSFLILYMILQYLQRRSILKKMWQFPLQLGLVLIITLILGTGGLGYSNKIPELKDIESVQMTYVGTPNYLSGQPGGISYGRQYYLTNSYTYTGQDIETVMELHKVLIDEGKGKLELNSSNFSSTTIPYDITVTYILQDGSKLTRYYDRTTYEVLEEMLALDDTNTVRKAVSDTITKGEGLYYASGAYKNGTVYVSSSWYTNPRELLLDPQQRQTLLSCIEQDVLNQNVEERYFPSEGAKGIIMFSLNGSGDDLNFGYNFSNTIVYLTPEFENTWNFFEDAGLTYCFDFTNEIESIELQECDPYISLVNTSVDPSSAFFMGYLSDQSRDYIQTKDFEKNIEITSEDKVKELASLLQNNYFMSRGGYLACAKIKDKEQYIYKYLPKDVVPDYIYQ